MDTSNKEDLKALQDELRRIDKGPREKCTVCRYIYLFAVAVFILVAVFVLFDRVQSQSRNEPLSPELAPPFDPAVYDQRILELGSSLHPEFTGSSTVPSRSVGTKPLPPPDLTQPLPTKRK